MRFFMEMENRYFQDMTAFLKKLGVKSLITGDADHAHRVSPYPHLIAFNKDGDFIDSHNYWEHPDSGPPHRLTRHTPMVNHPFDSTVVENARTPVKGKPFTVTELNAVFPHRYVCEHTPIYTSYALLQDWDGILWFNWGTGQLVTPSTRMEIFASANDPIRFSNMMLAGHMFHRQDIEKAKETVVRRVPRSEATDSLRWNVFANRPFYTPGFAKSTPLQHKVLWELVDDDNFVRPVYPSVASLGLIKSDTGQLTWKNADKQKGVVTINSPNTQGAVGFIGSTPENLDDVSITVDNEFATVVLTSLDGKPIRNAKRLLLVAHSYYQSTGFEWLEENKTVKQMGTLPMKILPVSGTVSLKDRAGAGKITATPLSGVGAVAGPPQDLTKKDNHWEATLGKECPTTWYLIEIHNKP
jgi:hypothetical protein